MQNARQVFFTDEQPVTVFEDKYKIYQLLYQILQGKNLRSSIKIYSWSILFFSI